MIHRLININVITNVIKSIIYNFLLSLFLLFLSLQEQENRKLTYNKDLFIGYSTEYML